MPLLYRVVLLFMLRYYLFLLFVPAAVLWVFCKKTQGNILGKYVLGYVGGIVFALALSMAFPNLNILSRLVETQHYYLTYSHGQGDIDVPILKANGWSFAKAAPIALHNAMLRPNINDTYNVLTLAAACESILILLFILLAVIFADYRKLENREFLFFCLFLSLSFFLLIGWIVDNLGPIVRYRSVMLPIWLSFFACIFSSARFAAAIQKISKRFSTD